MPWLRGGPLLWLNQAQGGLMLMADDTPRGARQADLITIRQTVVSIHAPRVEKRRAGLFGRAEARAPQDVPAPSEAAVG
jgi:hypothetical protein